MHIQQLAIQGLRNLHEVNIQPGPRMNLLYGVNASGKTSLLEAIHLLSCGKSFRTHTLSQAVSHGEEGFVVSARLVPGQGVSIHLGVDFQKKRLKMRAGGAPLYRTSQLAAHLPVVVIHQESHRLLREGPRLRRQYLDWGLFHVEHAFHPAWYRFMRALKQRNRLLQKGAARSQIEAWDGELNDMAVTLHRQRRDFVRDLMSSLTEYASDLLPQLTELTCEYRPGWPAEEALKTVLARELERDLARGYTHSGPHRADLVLRSNGIPVRDCLSRGQQKLLVCALYLAQAATYRRRTGRSCVLLVDDVAAELDAQHRDLLLRRLSSLEGQVFLTATEPFSSKSADLIDKRFHVEHGRVREVL